ncbi:MAG: cyclic 2,3-diphosphoglycerate synthase [Nanoarchaeota archaeon]
MGKIKKVKNAIIMGAAGRDFHNFLTYFKTNRNYNVVAFTAAQIPYIERRIFPKEIAGKRYPRGIPIFPEEKLSELIKNLEVDKVYLSYSDLSNQEVMEKAALVIANGADFSLLGANATMLKSKKPVVAVTAVRTGAGKSPTTRTVAKLLRRKGLRVVILRHPMPYGILKKEIVQRFSKLEDLEKQNCTFEEREEYEPHLLNGFVVYAGVDYAKILEAAEKEADVILWDGGNNDLPFVKSDLHICIADARRPGHEVSYYPGFSNLMMTNVVIINKVKTAKKSDIRIIEENVRRFNKKAVIVKADMTKFVDRPDLIRKKRVLVIEDGPTLTHGGMSFGAGILTAQMYGSKIIDPRKYAVGSIKDIYKRYGHIGKLLPAMGYGKKQIRELEKTINRTKCDAVIIATPLDLRRLIRINKPAVKVNYELEEIEGPSLHGILNVFVRVMRLNKIKNRK